MDTASFLSKPWRDHQLTDIHAIPVTMLNEAELTLLHWLTSVFYTGQGEIIDAGCFLGGSTAALAAGLEKNRKVSQKKGRINSFDLFILEGYAKEYYFTDSRYKEGDNTFYLFKENISIWADYINAFQGDICQFSWQKKPIEILFIDVAKTSHVNEFVVRNYFHHLIPGVSVIIQQDYVHEWLPWIHITMEWFKDYFSIYDYFGGGSVVFVLQKKIPANLLSEFSLKDISATSQIALMNQAIQQAPSIYQGVLKLPKVRLLKDLGFAKEARLLLEEVSKEYGHENRIAQGVVAMRQYVGNE
jgi:hypothetical protein